MDNRIITEQAEILKSAYHPAEEIPPGGLEGFFTMIQSTSLEVLHFALSDFGASAKRFCQEVRDYKHPDLRNVMDGRLIDGLSQDAQEVVQLCSLLLEGNYEPQDRFNALRWKIAEEPKIRNAFESPALTWEGVRFLNERDRRDIRCQKYQSCHNLMVPKVPVEEPSLLQFSRHHNCQVEAKTVLARRAERLASFGLHSMSDKVNGSMNNAGMRNVYLGFNRVAPGWIAAILWSMAPTVRRKNVFMCSPVEPYIPHFPEMEKLLNHLDHLPELSGYAAFDHYSILSVGDMFSWESVLAGRAYAALLGVRDGTHFFVSYWAEP